MRRCDLRLVLLLSLCALGGGCDAPVVLPTLTPVPPSTSPIPPTWTPPPTFTPAPTRTPVPPDTGWQPLHDGIEVRSLNVPAGETLERVTMARVIPDRVSFRVAYAPGNAYAVSAWAQQEGALLAINGGYFTAENTVTGLTISNGERYGFVYPDYAGMFAVTFGDAVSVRWLRTWPYDPAEGLREAVQCFPVLVKPGGIMGFPADADDGRASRRAVVAQDVQGRILFLIAPRGHLSLHALAVWLAGSDLGLDTALNLDGGTSAGFWVAGGTQIDSLIPVPSVIGVFPRGG